MVGGPETGLSTDSTLALFSALERLRGKLAEVQVFGKLALVVDIYRNSSDLQEGATHAVLFLCLAGPIGVNIGL